MTRRIGGPVAAAVAVVALGWGVPIAPANALTKTFSCVQGATDTSVTLTASWLDTEIDIVKVTIFEDSLSGVKLRTVRMTHLDKVNNSFSYTVTVPGVRSSLWIIRTYQDRYMEPGMVYCT